MTEADLVSSFSFQTSDGWAEGSFLLLQVLQVSVAANRTDRSILRALLQTYCLLSMVILSALSIFFSFIKTLRLLQAFISYILMLYYKMLYYKIALASN